jgi:hypothetical protein
MKMLLGSLLAAVLIGTLTGCASGTGEDSNGDESSAELGQNYACGGNCCAHSDCPQGYLCSIWYWCTDVREGKQVSANTWEVPACGHNGRARGNCCSNADCGSGWCSEWNWCQ